MTDLPRLHETVHCGRLTLRNRLVMPAHTTNFAANGVFSARHLAYHRARAAGGVGLIITEGMRVHPTSLGRTNTVSAFDDGVIPSLSALVEVVHGEGAKLAAQLLHVGRQSGGHNMLTPAWAASPIPWSSTAAVPHEMTAEEIAELVGAFGAAARRAATAGVDAVEVHLGHGHLLQQFLSPATNRRTDGYGGSLTNRLRITHEVLASVAAALPAEMPVILRISADEFIEGGLGVEEMLSAVGLLVEDHRIDVLHVSHSAYIGSASIATQMADMSFPPLAFRHLPRAFKKEFPQLSVVAVGRVDNLANAESLVVDGDADLVALARPHIANPNISSLPLVSGSAPARECIACNQGCAGRLEAGLPISCVVNPEAGMEREWAALRDAARLGTRSRVLVIGGGPAGLEAATAAASVGHEVTLAEAEDALGGALRLAAGLPMRGEFGRFITEAEAVARHAGVDIRLGLRADDELLAEGWDHVVVATGGVEVPDTRFPVLPLHTAVTDPESTGGHVVLLDEDGTTTALATADLLLSRGCRVTLLTDRPVLSWRVPVYSRPALLEKLTGRGFSAVLMRTPVRLEDGVLTYADPLSGEQGELHNVSSMITIRQRSAGSAPSLPGHLAASVVGDAYAPRTALEAAFEGRLAGLAVSGTPDVRTAAAALRGRL
ncbi:2,4-dienoyl-CoA reductase [Lentzea fradiae]|uniref:2,4-dienoyl-CoA reductase n=1 Tax=Lentzea fradiae TaxID=200378 RepID=A0A1G7KCW0_9PSEU|nr:FAD-dependent oxidoreductase [Lentzea fradiae]SDF35002.1 2,4-dienoyl-CoA reductase [Lentzea fradiae]